VIGAYVFVLVGFMGYAVGSICHDVFPPLPIHALGVIHPLEVWALVCTYKVCLATRSLWLLSSACMVQEPTPSILNHLIIPISQR